MYFIKPSDPNPISRPTACWLMVLCIVWLCTGLIGHDPWKPDEPAGFGIVYSMLQDGYWLVPTIADQPSLNHPPLYYWTAAALAYLFSPLLPLHDGARLASGLYMAITMVFMGLTGKRLYGESRDWACVIILIGCLGLLVRAHQLITDIALLTGLAMMLYGYSWCQSNVKQARWLLGCGVGIGFMAKGFIAPVTFILTSALLLWWYPQWRQAKVYRSLAQAMLLALPWLLIWPICLYWQQPTLFYEWLWQHNLGAWLHYLQHNFGHECWYYLKNLPWLAWPALPLALWVLWFARHQLFYRDDLQLPLVMSLVLLFTLSFLPHIKEVFVLPMLLPITLLATASLSTLKRGAANALDWFGLMTFTLLAILLWWGWAGLLQDNNAKITKLLKEYYSGFVPEFELLPFLLAIVATFIWLITVWRIGHSMRRAVLNWATGITLSWVLMMTLWMPWLDTGKSYANMIIAIQRALPDYPHCIGQQSLTDGDRAMLHYFGEIKTQADPQLQCHYRLVREFTPPPELSDISRWQLIWAGGRQRDPEGLYHLYRKVQ